MRLVIAVLRPLVWFLCRLVFRVRFYGVENVPPRGACIIAPNHVTYIDPVWITIPIKRRVYYMAWDKPFDIPVLGFLMRTFGAFPVKLEAADARARREAEVVLGAGKALVIFPEGGRTRTGKLEPFKMGAFRLAVTHGVPIVPVSIDGAYEIWPAGRWLPRPGRLTITYHQPIEVPRAPDDISRPELKDRAQLLARRTRDVLAEALEWPAAPESDSEATMSQQTGF
jgi:1-acyl-sn-glycerol-3-phosphate acyltransferase